MSNLKAHAFPTILEFQHSILDAGNFLTGSNTNNDRVIPQHEASHSWNLRLNAKYYKGGRNNSHKINKCHREQRMLYLGWCIRYVKEYRR